MVVFVVSPVTVVHVVVVHGPLPRVVLWGCLPHVGRHLRARLHLVVAVLHRGAGLGSKQRGLPDTVDKVVLGPGVTADPPRHGVLSERAAVLSTASVRVEVHVSELQDGA